MSRFHDGRYPAGPQYIRGDHMPPQSSGVSPGVAVGWPLPGLREQLDWLARQHDRIARVVQPDTKRMQGYDPSAPPWEIMPPDGQPFDPVGVLALPADGTAETPVLQLQVPNGWDGVIHGIGNTYEGGGFVDGSGDIIWRIRRDNAYVRNYDDIRVVFGDAQNPRDVRGGIRIYANELVEYTVEHVSEPGLTGQNVICQFSGWFWPRR